MDITFGPLFLDDEANTQLLPLFDHTLRTYSAELRQDGVTVTVAVHGQDEWFQTADALTGTVDDFLQAHGVRALSEVERYELYGGLLRVRGGAGYEVLIRQTARRS